MSNKKEYIERGALIDVLKQKCYPLQSDNGYGCVVVDDGIFCDDAVDIINYIPAADVEPVVLGEWKEFDADMNAYSCSVCNEPQMFIEGNPEQNEYSFCPHCGAYMERSGE